MTGSIEESTGRIDGDLHHLHFVVRFDRPAERVWPHLATPAGLTGWLTPVDVLEPHLGGTVALRDLGAGEVTAWDVERVAEYRLGEGGRLRLHLEPGGTDTTTLRLTHVSHGGRETERRWRARLHLLLAAVG